VVTPVIRVLTNGLFPGTQLPVKMAFIGAAENDMAYRAAEDWLSQTILNVEAVMKRHGFIDDFSNPIAVPLITTRDPAVVIEQSRAPRRLISRPAEFLSRFSAWMTKLTPSSRPAERGM